MQSDQRRALARWTGRLLLAAISCEGSLQVASRFLPSFAVHAMTTANTIACIGDSNTFGVGAKKGMSYPDQLGRLLEDSGSPLQVVNLGWPGQKADVAIDRLVETLDDGVPRCVLFLAGVNDFANDFRIGDTSVDPQAKQRSKLRSLLRKSATYRMLEAGYHVVRGELDRAEFGAQSEALIDPMSFDMRRWDESHRHAQERLREGSMDELFACLVRAWMDEYVDQTTVAWNELSAVPRFATAAERFTMRRSDYEWELAWLQGRNPAPLGTKDRSSFSLTYARWTAACQKLLQGEFDAARAEFVKLEPLWSARWAAFLRYHQAWCSLQERNFARAREEFDRALDRAVIQAPEPGLEWALAGGALAAVLDPEGPKLHDWIEPHKVLWNDRIGLAAVPLAQEWALAAQILDALRAHAGSRLQALWKVAREKYPEPGTAPLRWLFDNPPADFDRIRERLPLETLRATWLGPCKVFLPNMNQQELNRQLGTACDRLQGLAQQYGFDVVALTYLNYQNDVPNQALRDQAQRLGWPLVDMHVRYPREELARDDKALYFSADRAHPNDLGYGLFAQAVLERLVELGVAR